MAQEGIATLPMQGMPAPQESEGIGAFEPQPTDVPEVGERERFDAVMVALEQQLPEIAAQVEQILDEANLTPEQVQGLEYVVTFLEQNKDNYPAAIQSLIAEGAIEEGDFPPQYNEEFMVLLKMVVYGYQAREMTPEPVPFAKGGLAMAAEALRQQGRGGDTMLAHINPQEAALLKRMGGSGTINPSTGLPEFFKLKSIAKPFKAVGKAVGGAVKSVVGAASKVLGPQLTSIVATVGGFMIGGPAGAALAQGLVTYGQGGSLKDVLLNSATAYIGGSYGPTAGAIAGGGAAMLRGGSLKDAIKAAAISYGTSYAMNQMGQLGSQGQAPVTDLSQTGSIDAAGNFVPDAGVATPGSVSAVNPSGVGGQSLATPGSVSAANPSGTSGGFGLNAGPAPNYNLSGPVPTAPSAASGLGSLNYQAPTNYLAGAPSASSAGISSLGGSTGAASSPGFFSNLTSGNFGAAGSDALNFAKTYPGYTAMGALALTGAMGGFTPEQTSPPGLVDRDASGRPITGEELIAADPSKYVVQGMPGVGYDASGNIDPRGTPYQPNPAFQNAQTFATPQYGAPGQPTYPTYTPPMMAAAPVPGNPVPQPYNTMAMYNFMPSNQPRYMADGGIAGMFPPGESVMRMNRGGYPRKTGQISGPGTETSDDIPAMLSDGEFVVTAKAVRGIGNGSRRAGAKKLYRMMHAMEKKAGGKV